MKPHSRYWVCSRLYFYNLPRFEKRIDGDIAQNLEIDVFGHMLKYNMKLLTDINVHNVM